MSAGAFEGYFYTLDNGEVAPIRLQPETVQATFGGAINGPGGATAASDGFPSVSVSGSRRAIGIHPRIVTIRITAGLPTGYKLPATFRIPVLQESQWDAASKNGPAGYLGGTGTVVSKTKEVIV
jgi:hypothetical protein